MSQKNVHSIILDSSPILTNTPAVSTLLAKCEKLLTVPSVIDEIRDVKARSRLEVLILSFLTVRVPKPESVKFVSEFARKTGDLAVLSRPDIQILALSYEIECDQNGGDWRLRKSPGQKGLNGPLPTDKGIKSDAQSKSSSKDRLVSATEELIIADTEPFANGEDASVHASVFPEKAQTNQQSADVGKLGLAKAAEMARETEGKESSILMEEKQADPEPESSDSEGWITPSNLKKQQAKDQNASTMPIPEDQVMQVATITGDFAMQNVLLQIGLNLLSPSLERVKNIKTFILRCHACFEKVKDLSKQFCPRCGKPTLTRVSCSTNQKGEFKIHLKKNMQWNHRGDRFGIPRPVSGTANGKVGQSKGGGKGGWGQKLILAEDQKEYQRATNGRQGRKETDLMDGDYLPSILTGERNKSRGRPKVGAGRNVNSKRRF